MVFGNVNFAARQGINGGLTGRLNGGVTGGQNTTTTPVNTLPTTQGTTNPVTNPVTNPITNPTNNTYNTIFNNYGLIGNGNNIGNRVNVGTPSIFGGHGYIPANYGYGGNIFGQSTLNNSNINHITRYWSPDGRFLGFDAGYNNGMFESGNEYDAFGRSLGQYCRPNDPNQYMNGLGGLNGLNGLGGLGNILGGGLGSGLGSGLQYILQLLSRVLGINLPQQQLYGMPHTGPFGHIRKPFQFNYANAMNNNGYNFGDLTNMNNCNNQIVA